MVYKHNREVVNDKYTGWKNIASQVRVHVRCVCGRVCLWVYVLRGCLVVLPDFVSNKLYIIYSRGVEMCMSACMFLCVSVRKLMIDFVAWCRKSCCKLIAELITVSCTCNKFLSCLCKICDTSRTSTTLFSVTADAKLWLFLTEINYSFNANQSLPHVWLRQKHLQI